MSSPAPLRVVARLALIVGLVVAAVAPASPAAADPARPTDYRSRVLSTEPPLPGGVEVRVVGGDSFLELTVPRGHTAEVPDYRQVGEPDPPPYLRFAADGTVELNDRSTAAAVNAERYGTTARSDGPSPEPRWSRVADDGRYAWHDHRIHWMSPRPAATMDDRGRVDMGGDDGTWSVELVVDGTAVTVVGELVRHRPPHPAPWYALSVVVAAVVGVGGALAVRSGGRPPHRMLALLLVVLAVVAGVVGLSEWRVNPPGSGASALPLLLPAVGALAAAGAVMAARVRLVGLAAAVAALAAWSFGRRAVLDRAVLPTSLPYAVDRATTAVVLGTAVAVGALVVWRPPSNRPVPSTSSR